MANSQLIHLFRYGRRTAFAGYASARAPGSHGVKSFVCRPRPRLVVRQMSLEGPVRPARAWETLAGINEGSVGRSDFLYMTDLSYGRR
jgi:hypothetical protein